MSPSLGINWEKAKGKCNGNVPPLSGNGVSTRYCLVGKSKWEMGQAMGTKGCGLTGVRPAAHNVQVRPHLPFQPIYPLTCCLSPPLGEGGQAIKGGGRRIRENRGMLFKNVCNVHCSLSTNHRYMMRTSPCHAWMTFETPFRDRRVTMTNDDYEIMTRRSEVLFLSFPSLRLPSKAASPAVPQVLPFLFRDTAREAGRKRFSKMRVSVQELPAWAKLPAIEEPFLPVLLPLLPALPACPASPPSSPLIDFFSKCR